MESHRILSRRERQRLAREFWWKVAVWIVLVGATLGFAVGFLFTPQWLAAWWWALYIPLLIVVTAVMYVIGHRWLNVI